MFIEKAYAQIKSWWQIYLHLKKLTWKKLENCKQGVINERVIIKEVTRKYGTAKNCLETWSFWNKISNVSNKFFAEIGPNLHLKFLSHNRTLRILLMLLTFWYMETFDTSNLTNKQVLAKSCYFLLNLDFPAYSILLVHSQLFLSARYIFRLYEDFQNLSTLFKRWRVCIY